MSHQLIKYLAIALFTPALTMAATLRSGFSDGIFVGGLMRPIAMEFAPDGRLFVAEQDGKLRVIKGGNLLPAPFVRLNVDARGERGLLGVTFDPNFPANKYIYVHYTVPGATAHNRVSRFTAAGDLAVPGSERILLDLTPLSTRTVHNSGVMHFGADGKLYIATGDNEDGSNSQSLSTLKGKLLRINSNGTIPNDNPTAFQAIPGAPIGTNKAIWATGLRNPFTFSIEPGSGKIFINDVGLLDWEEINIGRAGANYGWPVREGPSTSTGFTAPIFVYSHDDAAALEGCAITGGTFYRPPIPQFPAEYVGKYFFADYCRGWIYYIDSANPTTATQFATDLDATIDLNVGPEGALYYLTRDTESVRRIRYTAQLQQGLKLSTTRLSVIEGTDATVTVALAQPPASNVVVAIKKILSDPSVIHLQGSLTFTPLNWDVPQVVSISAAQDPDHLDNGATLTFSAPGLASRRVVIAALDNDRPFGAPRAVITLPENGDTVSGRTAEFFGDSIDLGGGVKAKFYVDDVLKSTDRNSLNHYHYGGQHNSWDTKGLTPGIHILRMRVEDGEGLSGSHKIRVQVVK